MQGYNEYIRANRVSAEEEEEEEENTTRRRRRQQNLMCHYDIWLHKVQAKCGFVFDDEDPWCGSFADVIDLKIKSLPVNC